MVLAAMDEEQWDCIFHFALLPHKVDIQLPKAINIDPGVVMGKLVQLFLSLPPIPCLPCLGQPRDIRKRGSQVPF